MLKMAFKIIPNISTIFTDIPMMERLRAARSAGFGEVEMQFPYDAGSVDAWKEARQSSGLKIVLLNMFPGDTKKGELGCASHHDAVDRFRADLALSIEYCKALECKRLHILSGKRRPGDKDEDLLSNYVSNLKFAAPHLEEQGIEAIIEPINNISIPGYFLNNPDLAFSVIEKVQHKNLKIQFDFFHFQFCAGNLSNNFKRFLPHIGHVQIAQVPNRDEPDEPGEINYKYVFDLLRQHGYNGRVGAEYNQKRPTTSTKPGERDTFAWISEYGLEKA